MNIDRLRVIIKKHNNTYPRIIKMKPSNIKQKTY